MQKIVEGGSRTYFDIFFDDNFWHLDIWISFDIWILKFGFFIFIKLLMA